MESFMPYAESHVGVTLDSVLLGEGCVSFIDPAILKAHTILLILKLSLS